MFEEELSQSQNIFLNLITNNKVDYKIQNAIFCGRLNHDQSLNIYKNNYYQNLTKALAGTYEASFKILTKDLFTKLSYNFIKENPLHKNDLAIYGERFPVYLHKKGPNDIYPFLYELAILERSIKNLFLNDTKKYELLKITHPVHQIWSSLIYDEEEEIVPLEKEQNLQISRKNEHIIFKIL